MMRQLVCLLLGCGLLCPVSRGEDSPAEVRFTGSLAQPDGTESLVFRNFEVLLIDGDQPFFCVLDDERDGCPWPESYGSFLPAADRRPRVLVSYEQLPYSIALPFLKLTFADKSPGAEWSVGDWTLTIDDVRTTDSGETRLNVSARERRGRRQSLVFDAASGLLQSATMDVFMGQGEQFELQMSVSSVRPLADSLMEPTAKTIAAMLSLQNDLGRRPDSQQQELSARQITAGNAAITTLSELSAETPLAEAVFRIRRNLSRQQRRMTSTQSSRDRILSRPAPAFLLSLIDGGELKSSDLTGRTTVLHFWKYADKPLKEPYGQVGYLEFLFNRKSADGVRVVGVATNPALLETGQSRQAQRSARKLQEFMNLSYPIGFDDGSLIRALGDPRDSGGELPLWVVIGPDGKIAHYHAGFYEVDRRAGLRELSEALDAAR